MVWEVEEEKNMLPQFCLLFKLWIVCFNAKNWTYLNANNC